MTTAPAHTQHVDASGAGYAYTRWLGQLIVALTTVAMIIYVWDRGPDPIIDYGRELYLPWRITEGDVLYRDMRYFNGPLAPHLNAALFRVGGVGLGTLQAFNAGLILATGALVYCLVDRIAGPLAATATGVSFPILFACAHLGFGGTFNWLTPYSTDITYGVALALAMLACLGRAERRAGASRSVAWSAAAGGLFGLILLTKVEVVLASAAGAVVAFAGIAWQTDRARRGRALVAVGAFLGASIVPVVTAAILLARDMTIGQALGGIFGAWQYVGDERISHIRFYRWVLGTEDVGDSLRKLGAWTLVHSALIVLSCAIGWTLVYLAPRLASAAGVIWAMLLLAAGVVFWQQIPWNGALRPVPVLLLAAAAWVIFARVSGRELPTRHAALSLGLIAFAGALLAKMLLNVRAPHYGFALVMPATAVAIAVLVGWLPRRLGAAGAPVRGMALAMLALLLFTGLRTMVAWVARYTVPVGAGSDQFLADRERGEVVREVVEDLRAVARDRPHVTLLAVPDGLMHNYLARVVNPTGRRNFMPLDTTLYGEDRLAADLAARPPDYVALVHADHEIHGAKFFGRDYGFKLDAWIRANYQPVKLYGAEPYTGTRFGILLMERKPS